MSIATDVLLTTEKDFYSYPINNSVVTLNKDGTPLSIFSDDFWDFTPYIYKPQSLKRINFKQLGLSCDQKLADALEYELRLMMYGLIFFETNSRSQSASLIISMRIYAYKLIELGSESHLTISGIANKPFLFKRLYQYLSKKTKRAVKCFIGFFRKISYLSSIYKNHNFSLSVEQFSELEYLKNILSDDEIKQHLVIPTRIYSNIYNFTQKILEEYLAIKVPLEKMFLYILSSRLAYKSKQKGLKYQDGEYLREVVNLDLLEFSLKYNLKNRKDFYYYFFSVRNICITRIILLTGMRLSEAMILPINTLKIINLQNKDIVILNGYSGKLTKAGVVKTSWISSKSIQSAIDVAQSLNAMTCVLNSIDIL